MKGHSKMWRHGERNPIVRNLQQRVESFGVVVNRKWGIKQLVKRLRELRRSSSMSLNESSPACSQVASGVEALSVIEPLDADQYVHMIGTYLNASQIEQDTISEEWRNCYMQVDSCECVGSLFIDLPSRACCNLVHVASILQVCVIVESDSSSCILIPQSCPGGNPLRLTYRNGVLRPYGNIGR
mmetsp:Transcript_93765/g.148043  ORF Transcript_93765/g.148043 Transcript_93765/m.148043 type:complete len:184 (-) Transcript_93765:303-854(-)